MKENAVLKINKAGKISAIIILILKIILGIAGAGLIIGLIAMAFMPKNLFTVGMKGATDVCIDLSGFNISLSEEEQKKISDEISNHVTAEFDDVELGMEEAEVTENTITIRAAGSVGNISIREVMYMMTASAIYIVFAFITLVFCGRLAKAFERCSSPFEDNVIKNMQYLAYSLIPWILVSCITSGITSQLIKNDIDYNFSLNFTSVITVLLVLGLSYVFKYGAVLQKESDETL